VNNKHIQKLCIIKPSFHLQEYKT